MLTLPLLLALASIHAAVVVAPGANFLVVTQNALTYSRRAGLLTARGVATGTCIYVAAGFVGFAALVSQSPPLLAAIRIIGALYFAYLGFTMLRTPPRPPAAFAPAEAVRIAAAPDIARWQAYRTGLLTALSNPPAMLYFLSLFTTFIPPDASLGSKAVMAAMLVGISLTWYTVVALTFSDLRVRTLYYRFQRWLNLPFALLWFGLALRLATG